MPRAPLIAAIVEIAQTAPVLTNVTLVANPMNASLTVTVKLFVTLAAPSPAMVDDICAQAW